MRSDRLMRQALSLAEQGHYVFPCLPNSKEPATGNGYKPSTRDPRVIERWWLRSAYNIGIDCGRSGLLVVDCDVKNGAMGDFKFHRWLLDNGLVEHPRDVPKTQIVRTPSGGIHVYFKRPRHLLLGNQTGSLPPGIDIRGVGGYVLAVGSSVDGKRYELSVRSSDTIADIPEALVTALTPKPVERRVTTLQGSGSAYAAKALDSECETVERHQKGSRHNELLASARRMGSLMGAGRMPYHRDYVESRLLDAVSQQADPYPEAKAIRDIHDGIDYGLDHPRVFDVVTNSSIGLA